MAVRYTLLALPLTLIGLLGLAACASGPAGEARLEGNWQLQDFTLRNSNQTRLVGLEPFSMYLGDDGDASGRVNCNTWRGRYTRDGSDAFELNNVVQIHARCATEVTNIEMLERAFPELFAGTSRYRINGREMIVETARGDRLRFHATHRDSGQ